MNKIAHKAKRQFRQVKHLTAIATVGLLLGGSAMPIWACVPHVNGDYLPAEPIKTYNHNPLVLADDDDNLRTRSEVDAERIHEHADRAEDRAREDAHEAARDARIHADRAEVRVREHADRAERWTDRRLDDAQRHHEMEERNDN
jgi:hypothetical protein